MPLIWPPRKIRATMATIAMRARISAYSASPWPSSSLRKDEMRAMSCVIVSSPPFFKDLRGASRGRWNGTGGRRCCQGMTVFDCVLRRNGDRRRPGTAGSRRRSLCGRRSDGLADGVEDAADLAPQEDEGDDRDDRDESEDQRVFRESLAFVVVAERCDEGDELIHVVHVLLSFRIHEPLW